MIGLTVLCCLAWIYTVYCGNVYRFKKYRRFSFSLAICFIPIFVAFQRLLLLLKNSFLWSCKSIKKLLDYFACSRQIPFEAMNLQLSTCNLILLCMCKAVNKIVTNYRWHLWCRWERHLAGFPHLGVVDRWLATPNRARIAHWSLCRDGRINMQLNKQF